MKRVSSGVEAPLPVNVVPGVGVPRFTRNDRFRKGRLVIWGILAVVLVPFVSSAEQLKPETVAAFDRYVQLREQQAASRSFLFVDGLPSRQRESAYDQLKKGQVITERLELLDQGRVVPVPGGLIHHWIGTVFVSGVSLEQTLAFLQDYDHQYKSFGPEVERSKLVNRNGDAFRIFLRLRKTKVITVILDTEYDVKYTRLDDDHATSDSRSARIAEVEHAGQPGESEKPVGGDSGFLWRLNSYWKFQQRDGGVYIQLEAVSLTRDIPTGLKWLVGPFVTSIPRESLIFTLTRTREALTGRASHSGSVGDAPNIPAQAKLAAGHPRVEKRG